MTFVPSILCYFWISSKTSCFVPISSAKHFLPKKLSSFLKDGKKSHCFHRGTFPFAPPGSLSSFSFFFVFLLPLTLKHSLSVLSFSCIPPYSLHFIFDALFFFLLKKPYFSFLVFVFPLYFKLLGVFFGSVEPDFCFLHITELLRSALPKLINVSQTSCLFI